ncbi:MAG: ChbG/HpnK family deacetylase [Lachnospiraceae bacterium]|nr:ChbG/HpnK family deacetylase [Lachnospiraceae bacterium]
MPLIVNGDDFGKDEATTKAILEAFEKNYINSTTLMVNMPYAEEAVRLAKESNIEAIGLHLNLTEGFPLSGDIKNNPLICSKDGSFNAAFYHNLKYRLYMDEQTIAQIEAEFRAQIDKFKDYGFKRLHIDSHHHVHTNYPVFQALKRLSGTYRLDYLRLSRNMYKGGNILNRIYKLSYNNKVKKLAGDSTDLFGSYTDILSFCAFDDKRLEALLRSKKVEVMVHPMYDENGELVDTDHKMNEGWKLKWKN